MKVTPNLLEWLRAKFQAADLTYKEMERRCGGLVGWGGWRKLIQAQTTETTARMEDAICMVFGMSLDELHAIAAGKHSEASCFSTEAAAAHALWRWLRYDQRRIDAITIMGYEGDLPTAYRSPTEPEGPKS